MRQLLICLCFMMSYATAIGQMGYGFNEDTASFSWAENTPADCPFLQQADFEGIAFTGRYVNYTNADTWYPTWADDGHLYSPWTDGYLLNLKEFEPFEQSHPGYACNSLDYMGRKAATAQAKIIGNDPMNLQIVNLDPRVEASPAPYGGRYPCGSLIKDGVWYYGTYCLTNRGFCGGVGWTQMGPFVGFRTSTDYGKTWIESMHTPDAPLFNENPAEAPVKIGAPHFVDFGKNMMYSPDGKAYLVAHGSSDPDACNNWIQGDQIYLLRVEPGLDNLNDESRYEYFGGYDEVGDPVWTSDLEQIKPLLEWPGMLGCVTVTYNSGLDKYLMCITRGHATYRDEGKKGWINLRHDSMILMADELTGEWQLVKYLDHFGPVAYFLNIPSKFISSDGKTMWLLYSANWMDKNMIGNPPGSYYSMSWHEIKLLD